MKVTGEMTLKQCHFRITLCYAHFMQFETTDFYGSISNTSHPQPENSVPMFILVYHGKIQIYNIS